MSNIFSTVQPILMLELTEPNGNTVIVNTENILYQHVSTGIGTTITFIGNEVLSVKEEITVQWLQENT
tara:strand:- start:861 stop:1064 length:204 start_codon:yes stop_codon:yes gene_type:complete